MTVDFNDYFWGEKNNGFDVLYHNMKFGVVASKELSEFFREKSNIEEQNSKLMTKLAHKAGSGTLNSTFAPVWTILRTSAEKLSALHLQMVQKLTELVKDVAKYADELHKKHKLVKEEESHTLECVQAMQSSTAAVQKSKDLYTTKVLELEKLRKDNGSPKDIEKVESKLKKLQEDYKVLLDKHNPIKTEFERKMTQTCRRFQEIEEVHLRQMKEFLSTYLELVQNNHDMVGQVHSDFKRQFLDMTVDKLLEQFVLNKYTGLEKPEISELPFITLSTQPTSSTSSHLNISNRPISPANLTDTQQQLQQQHQLPKQQQQPHQQQQQQQVNLDVLTSSDIGGSSLNSEIVSGSRLYLSTTKPDSDPKSQYSSAERSIENIENISRALSPEPIQTTTISTTATSVKSNIRSWFSIPSTKHSTSNTTSTCNNNSSSSSSNANKLTNGNFGTDTNSSSSINNSQSANHSNSPSQQLDNSNTNIIQSSFISSALTQLSEQNSASSSSVPISGILRSRREKTKTKKLKKKKELEAGDGNKEERNVVEEKDHLQDVEQNKVQKSSSATVAIPVIPGVVPTAAPEVDEDGYSIQPQKEAAWEDNPENAGSFYSDSDSDSDNDKPDKKIHVKIKPLNNGTAPMSASVDELRATVGNISLSPVGIFSHSQQLEQSSIASRQQSPEVSNASTPTATVHPYAPLQSPTLSMSNNSRYADLGDIFSEVGEISASAPASATISKSVSRQIPTPTSANSIAIPRPPSRRSEMAPRGRISPSSMSRADSVGSMEFRMGVGHGSSRGPSPLTIGISDTIPLAVAFHEIIHAYFRGTDESRCQVKITGDMMLSFPAGIAGVLANNPNPARLGFRMKNINNLENIVPNQELVQVDHSQSDMVSTVLEFNMTALTAKLRRQSEQSPSAAYFNVEILKYQVRSKPGASSCPFQLVSYWKCEPTYTALKIDYKYNNHAMAVATPLLNVTLSVPVNGSVRNVQSKPHSAWLGESNRLVWNFTDISQNSQGGGVGTLRARLELNDGPSTPNTMTTQFNCEGTTLSGIEFELIGNGYRQSLVKRRFVSGKYICEGDGIRSGATPTPPSVGSSSPYSAKSN
ncbi:F-BAR domain only protein 2 isoform X3 [Episyrphus balteatus]|uniref:F-BAR domain only protein 2 isoform X3 n=1 Tax=Episyrphus balteatus TaxID=286459 RepID=UPI002485EF65|nr:F-BAR domain only protein 2 isoform X3 [Episyrphus balteatus]